MFISNHFQKKKVCSTLHFTYWAMHGPEKKLINGGWLHPIYEAMNWWRLELGGESRTRYIHCRCSNMPLKQESMWICRPKIVDEWPFKDWLTDLNGKIAYLTINLDLEATGWIQRICQRNCIVTRTLRYLDHFLNNTLVLLGVGPFNH